MSIDEKILPWHQLNWEQFFQYIHQQRVPQALLITGQKGLGKQQLTLQLSQSLLCTEKQANGFYCGKCHSCVLFQAKTHPDFISVSPEQPGKNISIGMIRELITKLTLMPQFETYRTVIINPADQMNNAAANAFLKCLEEPTARTLIILISEKSFLLPATIVSRCQQMQINAPERQLALAWLKQQQISETNPMALLNLSHGAPLLARTYAENKMLTHRNKYFNAWIEIANHQINPVTVAEQWLEFPDHQLLTWMLTWVADVIKCRSQCETCTLFNPDLKIPLQELAQRLELKCLFQYYDLILNCKQQLKTQINKQLMLEEILIRWFNLKNI